jgi:hypothetical protein
MRNSLGALTSRLMQCLGTHPLSRWVGVGARPEADAIRVRQLCIHRFMLIGGVSQVWCAATQANTSAAPWA